MNNIKVRNFLLRSLIGAIIGWFVGQAFNKALAKTLEELGEHKNLVHPSGYAPAESPTSHWDKLFANLKPSAAREAAAKVVDDLKRDTDWSNGYLPGRLTELYMKARRNPKSIDEVADEIIAGFKKDKDSFFDSGDESLSPVENGVIMPINDPVDFYIEPREGRF